MRGGGRHHGEQSISYFSKRFKHVFSVFKHAFSAFERLYPARAQFNAVVDNITASKAFYIFRMFLKSFNRRGRITASKAFYIFKMF